MTDWHSHILPGVDDGSKSVEESLALLEMLKAQGMDNVAATPHFYADRQSLDSFLENRGSALEALKARLPEEAPRILCGAEVLYYPGISVLDGLRKLHIEGTSVLLMEMPEAKWPESTLREIISIASQGRRTLVLAHVERCMPYQAKGTWERLLSSGVLMQANASAFLDGFRSRRAFAALAAGKLHFLGSDCHNTTTRAPRIGQALERIEKKLGWEAVEELQEAENQYAI